MDTDLLEREEEIHLDLAVAENLYKNAKNKMVKEALNKLRWLLIAESHSIKE